MRVLAVLPFVLVVLVPTARSQEPTRPLTPVKPSEGGAVAPTAEPMRNRCEVVLIVPYAIAGPGDTGDREDACFRRLLYTIENLAITGTPEAPERFH